MLNRDANNRLVPGIAPPEPPVSLAPAPAPGGSAMTNGNGNGNGNGFGTNPIAGWIQNPLGKALLGLMTAGIMWLIATTTNSSQRIAVLEAEFQAVHQQFSDEQQRNRRQWDRVNQKLDKILETPKEP
ncbi:MAG: hypothetical protein KGL39_33395 [Patescibacteria group bacterium]|nr:hypothetical protein [Patescibacteria group bacterium]